LPSSKCHGWPQLWLPRPHQLVAPSIICEHAVFEGNHWQACQPCASKASTGGGGGNAPALAPIQGETARALGLRHLCQANMQPVLGDDLQLHNTLLSSSSLLRIMSHFTLGMACLCGSRRLLVAPSIIQQVWSPHCGAAYLRPINPTGLAGYWASACSSSTRKVSGLQHATPATCWVCWHNCSILETTRVGDAVQ
jgi:hypothetical protein